jgi:hypothetical protein
MKYCEQGRLDLTLPILVIFTNWLKNDMNSDPLWSFIRSKVLFIAFIAHASIKRVKKMLA